MAPSNSSSMRSCISLAGLPVCEDGVGLAQLVVDQVHHIMDVHLAAILRTKGMSLLHSGKVARHVFVGCNALAMKSTHLPVQDAVWL